MTAHLVDPQGQLLRDIKDKRLIRDDIAVTYAFALRQAEEVNFLVVNDAIIDRWSLNGLTYIKSKAWKLLD